MRQTVTVAALGPDEAGNLTLDAARALTGAGAVLLRTGRHGVAQWLTDQGVSFDTLDGLYEREADFDALNRAAAEEVLRRAEETPSLVYGVADPATDATVEAMRALGAALRILPGVSLASRAQGNALEAETATGGGLVSLPASAFAAHRVDPAAALLVTELASRLLAGEVKLRLLEVYAPETAVLFTGKQARLDELDRQPRYDHLSYAYLPPAPMTKRGRYTFYDLLDVMARLRRPGDGCPWDREQTHKTLREYVIEEAYEVVEAIDSGDPWRLADELGDVLLQVVFHAQVAKEHGAFHIGDVTTAICRKMIDRHAHIFGDVRCDTASDVLKSWEAIKAREKGHRAVADAMRDIPGHFPALMRAGKVQRKAAQAGFDWDRAEQALEKVREEAAEVAAELALGRDPEAELGDLLFAVVNVARLCGAQSELALGAATEKFIRRFAWMERAVENDGGTLAGMTLPEMDVYWDAAKAAEKEVT